MTAQQTVEQQKQNFPFLDDIQFDTAIIKGRFKKKISISSSFPSKI